MQQVIDFSQKYCFFKALRPFSFSVALMTCGLGVTLAYKSGEGHLLRAILVMVTGVLLQAAVNLFNDYADLGFWQRQANPSARQIIYQIRRNALCAVVLAVVACLLGLYLVSCTGWLLLLTGLFGVAGGYFYTAEPVNLKERGLGLVAVFVFTGLLMVEGAYMAVAGVWSFRVLLLALPLSILSSLMLLANELRDVEDDSRRRIKTFTVRWGFAMGRSLYLILFLVLFVVVIWLTALDYIHESIWLLPSVICLYWPFRLLFGRQEDLSRLPPVTGRVFLVFGFGLMCAV